MMLSDIHIYTLIAETLKQKQKVALCTIVDTKGSAPLKAGAKMLVMENGKTFGTIGGGALEMAVIQDALDCVSKEKNQLYVHRLTKDHKMCCGGTVWIYIETILPPSQLLIFGAGHVGQALADLSSKLNFEVTIIDDRKNMLPKNNTHIQSVWLSCPEDYFQQFAYNHSNSYCVIATYNHELDRKILLNALQKNWKYIGMIGSLRKVQFTKKFLNTHGIAEDVIEKIDMPIGLDINAYAPYEIAVSIMAKIIQVKNQELKSEKYSNKLNEECNYENSYCNGGY